MNSLKGKLLIAVPELGDQNFFRSVVLMVQHDEQGAMGVILNRPSNVMIANVWEDLFGIKNTCHELIYFGGPVEGPLMLLHAQLGRSELDVLPGVFMSMGKDHLTTIIEGDLKPFRLYSGYSGWGPGQLEAEIEAGGWLTMAVAVDDVFSSSDNLWKLACEKFGSQILDRYLGGQRKVPSDPSLN